MTKTSIEWTDVTWNPTRGCSRVSEGCRHCYAERVAGRFSGPGGPYEGLVQFVERERVVRREDVNGVSRNLSKRTTREPRWNGMVQFLPDKLDDPLHWRKPRMVFVNSMSDLFHESLQNEEIAAVFGVMAKAQAHTFQVLTKRPERMQEWFAWLADSIGEYDPTPGFVCGVHAANFGSSVDYGGIHVAWPLPNVWLGVSVEDQKTADERIPLLLETPAIVRFVSYEPALGPVDFTLHGSRIAGWDEDWKYNTLTGDEWVSARAEFSTQGRSPALDWVIAGSESGKNARPADLDWYRSVRDQCTEAGVAFFLKQHAELGKKLPLFALDGQKHVEWPHTFRTGERK